MGELGFFFPIDILPDTFLGQEKRKAKKFRFCLLVSKDIHL